MTNHSLHLKIIELVVIEKKSTADVVEHFALADQRRLYLDYGVTSLFAYLTSLGYSPACAQARVDAARMLRDVPSVAGDLRSGVLNLSQIGLVARGARRRVVSAEEKRRVLEAIRGKDLRATELVVSRAWDLPVLALDKKRVQQDESVRVEVTFSKEQRALLERVKELVSHVNPNPSVAELFSLLAQDFIKRRTSDPKSHRVTKTSIRRAVFRQRGCQWRFADGKICASKFQLQIDHIVPRWAGGSDERENLQLLCAAHNRLKFRLGS